MTQNEILSNVKKIHFIGIGGSGMCPLAEILHHNGYRITGSDVSESDTLERIRSYGIPVSMGHKPENIGDAELVVYTAAVKQDNPELAAAREKGVEAIERSVLLGLVTSRYANSIAVSGTHGKTTTTALITQVFLKAGLDPTAVIGGKLPFIGGNGRVGKSDTIVCEACEYVDTFLQLHPATSIILNVDADHLDYFKNMDNIIRSFHQFSCQTSREIIVNGDDPEAIQSVKEVPGVKIITFGMKESNDYAARDIRETSGKACETFTVFYQGKPLCEVSLSIPGKHNVYNALAAFAAAHLRGLEPQIIADALHSFTGVHRRFEILGEFGGITVADDFAHHPTELTATLSAAMSMGFRQVWAVFQPHTFSRTYLLLNDFAVALSIPDHAVLTEILPVRETNEYNIHTQDLAGKIPGSVWFKTFEEVTEYVTRQAQEGDLILTIGGGDVYKCANQIVSYYKNKA